MLPVYATQEDYGAGNSEWSASVANSLYQASRHIDSLTFNRIVDKGFDSLTPFQKDIITEVTLQLANFESENEDLINSIISSYSINGVSVGLSQNENVSVENGVVILKPTYALLKQTGLCCRRL